MTITSPFVEQPSRARLLGRPTLGGLAGGLLFWWVAATPTLIPRDWYIQAAISGVSLAVGYLIGTLIGRIGGSLLGRRCRTPGAGARRRTLIGLSVAWLVGVVSSAFLWIRWQNEQRLLMGIETVGWADALAMVAASLVIGATLVVIGRTLVMAVAAVDRFSHRHAPAGLAGVVTVLITVTFVIAVGVVVVRVGTDRLMANYEARDEGTEAGIEVPDSASVSGSSESLVAWDTLGLHGRRFVATATTAEQLAAFHGAEAELAEPVRVYVGLKSADSTRERAELAVRELERAGGFDRQVLAVWVPTGSGWVVQEAADALELLYRGDTAIVAMQYSFLPSLFTFVLEPELADEAGKELFAAVRTRWSQLPPDRRPTLVLFGMSLGTTAVETPFVGSDAGSSVANLVAQTDGALLVGAAYRNIILSQLTRERDPGSPVWQPVFDQGRSVRFLNRDPNQPSPGPDWPSPRFVYLQHPSDPVTYWSVAALWWPPEWMDRPRGFDVPDEAMWFPVVSAVQAVADVILMAPPGFGHRYSIGDYVNGWAQMVPPVGWTDADTDHLTQFLESRDYPPQPWAE
jgi:uncharacterized membrane protein